MRKEYLFKNRVIVENKVFLLAEDVAKIFGYDSLEIFANARPELIVEKNGLPKLVEETKYNTIILGDVELSDRIKHLEYTRVDTLRSRAETLRSFYPLKFMLAGGTLERKAHSAGYESVEKYINDVDYPKEFEDAGVDLMYCQCPGIDFYISQKEMIKMLSPSQYSNIILVDGVEDFDFAKYITPIED